MGFWWYLFACNLLIPVVMIVAGRWMWRHGPKKRNCFRGYRTRRSMKNAETWTFAQVYCGRLWWRLGWLLVIPTVLAQLPFRKREAAVVETCSVVLVSIQLVLLVLTIFPTERALKKKFGD